MRPLRTQAVKNFLMARTHPDLANLYSYDMEVQVNVAPDGGERIGGDYKGRQWHGFTDGINTWKPFRVPRNANTDPEYEDVEMNFDLDSHAEGIGMTGWDWKNRVSLHVAYDFDAISGHSDKHKRKLTDVELREVQDRINAIPWTTLRKSTSGSGLHLYVFIEPTPTSNHNEHAALARAILGMLSAQTGFDFHGKVDICGGNMWVWHRKMRGTDGLRLIKQGEVLTDIPPNWRDHIPVVSGKRGKTLPEFIENSDVPELERIFEDLTGQGTRVPLDDDHRKLLDWLRNNNCMAHWDQDRHMLVTHTFHLKEAHEDLNLKGIFKTLSTGTERGIDQNCFCFPIRKGAWAIRRFTPGVQEDPSWTQDGAGWTRCFYNREPDLATASKANDGIEHKSGGFVFAQAEQAQEAARQLGVDLDLPNWALHRRAKLKEHKDGRLIVDLDHDANRDLLAGGLKGWLPESKVWTRVFDTQLRSVTEADGGNYDDLIRHIVTETGEDCGWTLKADGVWADEPLTHVKAALQGALSLNVKEATQVIGSSVLRHWKLVNRPFQPEYPGDRQWNRGAAQFVYHPTENLDDLNYPTWLKVLEHCGYGLNDAVKINGWCKANGILTGADYLKVWVASLFQYPLQPLPYLFLYSMEQNTGKSILHEALSLLVTSGVERADTALTSQGNFNGELAAAILCVVEETDLSKSKVAYNRIKDWVTSRQLPIHPKGGVPHTIPNTTHWIQCSNDPTYCPILPGDTRITMVHVSPLDPVDLIPKEQLLRMLQKEAPDFMAAVLSLEIPPSNDRLNIPVVETGEKVVAQESNRTELERFIIARIHSFDGVVIKFSEFYDRFIEGLDANERNDWSKIRVGRELPPHMPNGRSTKDGQFYIANVSWTAPNGEAKLPKFIVNAKGMLERLGDNK
jgi:hypothetical protein